MLSVISVRVTLDHRLRRLVSLPTSMNSTSPLETEASPGLLSSHEDPDGPAGTELLRSAPGGPAASLVLGLTPPATCSLPGRIWSGETKFADNIPEPQTPPKKTEGLR